MDDLKAKFAGQSERQQIPSAAAAGDKKADEAASSSASTGAVASPAEIDRLTEQVTAQVGVVKITFILPIVSTPLVICR